MNNQEKLVYSKKAEIIKSLSHPVRLAILDLLIKGQKTVEQISSILSEKQSNVSKHLSILKLVGLVDNTKVGLNRYYYIKNTCVKNLSLCITQTLKQRIKQNKIINI